MNIEARNLNKEEPRPMSATLGGYAWLPRMVDKARASRAGTLGDYYRYPCPIDRTCLQLLGIDADAFADLAQSNNSDNELLRALHHYGVATPDNAAFDPVKLNEELHSNGS